MRSNVVQKAGQLSLSHVAISKTERTSTTNIKPMSSSYNTLCIKHNLVVSIYSNTETSLAMSVPTILMVSRFQSPCPWMEQTTVSCDRSAPSIRVFCRYSHLFNTFVPDFMQCMPVLSIVTSVVIAHHRRRHCAVTVASISLNSPSPFLPFQGFCGSFMVQLISSKIYASFCR